MTQYHPESQSPSAEACPRCGVVDTALLLDELAPGKRTRSRYVTQLIHADAARREERQRLRDLQQAELVAVGMRRDQT